VCQQRDAGAVAETQRGRAHRDRHAAQQEIVGNGKNQVAGQTQHQPDPQHAPQQQPVRLDILEDALAAHPQPQQEQGEYARSLLIEEANRRRASVRES
jgi:hypothetical protein